MEIRLETKIRDEILELNRGQLLKLAWLGAIRTLPFLGYNGNFDFWSSKNRKKYLYSILQTLDTNFYIAKILEDQYYKNDFETYKIPERFIGVVANNVAENLKLALATRLSGCDKDLNPPFNSANAVFNSANTAVSVIDANEPLRNAAWVVGDAVLEFIKAANVAKLNYDNKFETIVLQDIDYIKHRAKAIRNTSIEIYGDIWNNFLKSLYNCDCNYWAKLYLEIFLNGISIDTKRLDIRICVPVTIQKEGASIVGKFIEKIEKDEAFFLNETRILIFGAEGVGKTYFANKMVNPQYKFSHENEEFDFINKLVLKMPQFKTYIWDFPGIFFTHVFYRFFMCKDSLNILICNENSDTRYIPEYWLNYIKNHNDNNNTFLIVNKCGRHQGNINVHDLQEKYQSTIKVSWELSIKEDEEKFIKLREYLLDYIKENPYWNEHDMCFSYLQVKEEIIKLFNPTNGNNTSPEYILVEDFKKITDKYYISKENIDDLLNKLNGLGICLRYKEIGEISDKIFNSEWISTSIFKIIIWAYDNKLDAITPSNLKSIFKDNKLNCFNCKYDDILYLMKYYGLGYYWNDKFVIPNLRPKASRKSFNVQHEECLEMYISVQDYGPNPGDMLSRFIVENNKYVMFDGGLQVWNDCVIFEDKEYFKAWISENNNIFYISVMGKDRTKYISQLRDSLINILKSYKGLEPKIFYKYLDERGGINYKTEDYILRNTEKCVKSNTTIIYNINRLEHQYIEAKSINYNLPLKNSLNDLSKILKQHKNEEFLGKINQAVNTFDNKNGTNNNSCYLRKLLTNVVVAICDPNSQFNHTITGINGALEIAEKIIKYFNIVYGTFYQM